jgi:hypothetical protein
VHFGIESGKWCIGREMMGKRIAMVIYDGRHEVIAL